MQLVYYNEIRYKEKAHGDEDRIKKYSENKVFPNIAKKLPISDKQVVPDSYISIKSLVKQDHEPEHLLLHLKGKLVVTTTTEEKRDSGLPSISLYHLLGQPKVGQIARELPPSINSLASNGVFLCISKEFKPFLWIGQLWILQYGLHVKINEINSFISKSLFSRILLSYYSERNLKMPKYLPEIKIIIEGRESENKEIFGILGDQTLIKNELKYRKKVLDSREVIYLNSTHGFNFAFEENYRLHTLVHKDKDISIMDTHKEIFLLVGIGLQKEERIEKIKATLKAFFAAKKSKSLIQKVTVTFFLAHSKVYSAMKYLVV